MRSVAVALAALALAPAATLASSETSLRCPGGIVSLGDATIDLLGKCGAPTLREVRAADTYAAVDTVATRFGLTALLTSERWTYDFGPSQFLMFAIVEGGRVVAFHRGNYGYARTEAPVAIPRASCDTNTIKIGDAKIDLLARCGEPALVEMRKENAVHPFPAVLRDSAFLAQGALRDVEVWTYDFGTQSFVRFVFIDDGLVVRIETGNRGYAR